MKRNIKLNKLAKNAMKEKEMNHVRGGYLQCCTCGCNGSSATDSNGYANSGSGLNSPGGGTKYCTVVVTPLYLVFNRVCLNFRRTLYD